MYLQRFFGVILCIAIATIANIDGTETKPTWEQFSSWKYGEIKSFLDGVREILREVIRKKSSVTLLDKQVGKDLQYKIFNGHIDKFSKVGFTIRHMRSNEGITVLQSFYWPKLEVYYDYKINEDDEPKKIRCTIEPIDVRLNFDINSENKTVLFSKIDFNNGAVEIFMEDSNSVELINEPNLSSDLQEIISSEITVQASDLWALIVDRVNENSISKYTYDSVIPVDH
ncbi:uncharacterized protein LOC106655676 [Trichogramma pretiosum]|uniref:uncharacterized protein LOC106655676 n=1 Tax=Trichogramma pretiosum TaxID=7493 RepID=UPI000C71C88E|nr:uncharacterized protein LOC106655676 [Trichogramma pretiosum]